MAAPYERQMKCKVTVNLEYRERCVSINGYYGDEGRKERDLWVRNGHLQQAMPHAYGISALSG